jgi:hypothetical protein
MNYSAIRAVLLDVLSDYKIRPDVAEEISEYFIDRLADEDLESEEKEDSPWASNDDD